MYGFIEVINFDIVLCVGAFRWCRKEGPDMEEIEFQRAWTSKFYDSKSNEKGSEHAEEKGYVMLSTIIPMHLFGFKSFGKNSRNSE